jgi:hypothetical protein
MRREAALRGHVASGIIEVGSGISLSSSSIARTVDLVAVTGSVPPAIGGRAQPSL